MDTFVFTVYSVCFLVPPNPFLKQLNLRYVNLIFWISEYWPDERIKASGAGEHNHYLSVTAGNSKKFSIVCDSIELTHAATFIEIITHLKLTDEALCDNPISIDPTLMKRWSSLQSHPITENFIKHCCQLRHYSFCV